VTQPALASLPSSFWKKFECQSRSRGTLIYPY
jgi:hypothetical protein